MTSKHVFNGKRISVTGDTSSMGNGLMLSLLPAQSEELGVVAQWSPKCLEKLRCL